MADIPINNVQRRVQFTGNTTTGPFAFTFNILADADIVAYKNTTLLTLTTDYTVSTNANGTGSITLTSALVASDVLTIIGARALERTTDFVTAGDLLASSLNEQLDSIVIMAQQLDEKMDRAMKVAIGDVFDDLEIPSKSARLGTVLGFNATTGNPEAGPNISDVQSLAAITADIGTLADIEDGTEATDAISGLAAIKANVTTAAGISGNITTVAGISANVTTVAGVSANVTTVAGIASNVTSVAGVASDVTTVAGIASDVSTVASDSADIQTVANNIATIGTKATVDEATALAIALGQESNMANEFKVITRDVAPASAGTPETIYTVQSGSTIVVLGLTLANVHNAQVTASVTLVSTTAHTGQTTNTTAHLIKDAAIPAGSTLSVLDGKVNLNVGDIIKVDCSVADKVSVIMSYMEQT